jgi:hypothetical protein
MLKLRARRRDKKSDHNIFNLSKVGALYPDQNDKTDSFCK